MEFGVKEALESRTDQREVHGFGNDEITGDDLHLHGIESIQDAGYFSVSWKEKLPIRPNEYDKSRDEEQYILSRSLWSIHIYSDQ